MLEKGEDLAGFVSEFVGTNRCSRTGACASDRSEGSQDGSDVGARDGEFRALKYSSYIFNSLTDSFLFLQTLGDVEWTW